MEGVRRSLPNCKGVKGKVVTPYLVTVQGGRGEGGGRYLGVSVSRF